MLHLQGVLSGLGMCWCTVDTPLGVNRCPSTHILTQSPSTSSTGYSTSVAPVQTKAKQI